MPPQRPNLILSTHIPHIELDILVRDRLDVEAHRRDGGDVLVQLQFVEDGRLARGVESQHQQTHLFRPEDLAHHLGDLAAHGDGVEGEEKRCVGWSCSSSLWRIEWS